MREESQRGLDWRKEFGRGGTEIGIARARDISNGKNLPLDTVKRMASYFARHEVDKKGQGFNQGEEGYPSNGRIAWALWGGDAGQTWSTSIVNQTEQDRSADMSSALNLPEQVMERLGDAVEKLTSTRSTKRGKVDVEVRTLAKAPEITTPSSDSFNLRGYATVYDVAYPVAGGPDAGGWMETIERGATAKSIKDGADTRLLFDHDGIPLARTASGTMRLLSDDLGMMVDANLDPASPYAQSVRSAVMRGDADQMSFAFRVTRQEWNEDYTERRIKEVQLFDASVVTYPASEATVVQMNSTTPKEIEERELDPAAEAQEDSLVDQIKSLLAQLVQGEAAELGSGSPAIRSLQALVNAIYALDCWEEIDEAEDASGDEEMSEMASVMEMNSARSTVEAREVLRSLTA
jgi:HK97 family phage prohead protease